MSIRYVAAVLDKLLDLTATETLVLVALADYASDDTRECWPSMATIARRARCDRRTAQRCLRRLEQRGLIATAIGGHFQDANKASQYRLKFDYDGQIVADAEPDKLSTGGRHSAAGGAAYDPKGGGTVPRGGRHRAAPSVIRSVIDPKSDKKSPTKTDPRELTDDELDERARTGKLSAVEERERELRRRMRVRKAAP